MMRSHNNLEKGFVGLLMLVITVAIIAWLTWKYELGAPKAGENMGKAQVETPAELQAIQAAQNAKNMLENQSRQAAQVQ